MKEGNFFKKKIENVTKKILKVAIPIVGMATLPNTLNAQAPKENKPIYTSDKSKADAYKDSLDNYNYGQDQLKIFNDKIKELENTPGTQIKKDEHQLYYDPYALNPYEAEGVEGKRFIDSNYNILAFTHPHRLGLNPNSEKENFGVHTRNGQEPVVLNHFEVPGKLHTEGEYPEFKKPTQPLIYLDTKGYSPSDIKKVDQFLNTSRLPSTIPFLNGKQEEGKWNTKYYAVTFADGKKYMLTEEEFEFLTNKF